MLLREVTHTMGHPPTDLTMPFIRHFLALALLLLVIIGSTFFDRLVKTNIPKFSGICPARETLAGQAGRAKYESALQRIVDLKFEMDFSVF